MKLSTFFNVFDKSAKREALYSRMEARGADMSKYRDRDKGIMQAITKAPETLVVPVASAVAVVDIKPSVAFLQESIEKILTEACEEFNNNQPLTEEVVDEELNKLRVVAESIRKNYPADNEAAEVKNILEVASNQIRDKYAYVRFVKEYDALVAKGRTIQYDAAWENGTDYLNHAPKLCTPDVAGYGPFACHDTNLNRRIIIQVTRKGTVVMFERYSLGKFQKIVVHGTGRFSTQYKDTNVSANQLSDFLNHISK